VVNDKAIYSSTTQLGCHHASSSLRCKIRGTSRSKGRLEMSCCWTDVAERQGHRCCPHFQSRNLCCAKPNPSQQVQPWPRKRETADYI